MSAGLVSGFVSDFASGLASDFVSDFASGLASGFAAGLASGFESVPSSTAAFCRLNATDCYTDSRRAAGPVCAPSHMALATDEKLVPLWVAISRWMQARLIGPGDAGRNGGSSSLL